MALAEGTRLGPYEVVSPLGAGGMGEVYRARDTRLGRDVAVKVLPSHFSDNAELKQRFEREARAISSLNHPNICTLHDVGHDSGIDYLVLEFIEGESLSRRLEKGALPVKDVLRVGGEIADALEKAHRAGIVHRDLKPGNIMLTKSGAKLLDFGLAKPRAGLLAASATHAALTQTSATSPVTQQGTIVGTFQYLSPEQVEGKEADARSDIFSLGAVLYEMATGKRAFDGKSQISVASAILEKEPEPITAVQPMSPVALDHVVRTCLAKDPEQRYQTAHDVGLELKWVAESGSQIGVAAPIAAQRKLHRRLVLAAAIVGWVLAVAAVIATVRTGGQLRQAQRPLSAEINPPAGLEVVGALLGAPAISPDGTKVAFVVGDGRGVRIWIRDLASGSSTLLDGTDGAAFVFWSPDGRQLAFFAGGKLKKMAAGGGPVQILCDAPEGRGGAWSPNGTIIFTPNILESLYRVPEGGGTPQKITDAKPGWTHRNPVFLPDGEHFLFVMREPAGTEAGSLYAGSLKGGEPKLVVERASNAAYSGGYLLFFRDGNLVTQEFDPGSLRVQGSPIAVAEKVDYWNARDMAYFAASANGLLLYRESVLVPTQPMWMDRTGRELDKIGEPGFYTEPALSDDGTKLALIRVDKETQNGDVWLLDLKRGTMSRVTFTDAANITYTLSPDGNSVAVATNNKGLNGQMWTQSVSSSGTQQKILDTGTWLTAADWSRDGRYLFAVPQENATREDVVYVDLKGDRKPVEFLHGPASEQAPRLSPNGKWLAYQSDESGRPEVYVTAFPGPGSKWQISNGGGQNPSWSHDGKQLYYIAGPNLMAVDIQDPGSFEFGSPKALPVAADLQGFAPGPTAERFLVLKPASATRGTPLHLVLNWSETLKK